MRETMDHDRRLEEGVGEGFVCRMCGRSCLGRECRSCLNTRRKAPPGEAIASGRQALNRGSVALDELRAPPRWKKASLQPAMTAAELLARREARARRFSKPDARAKAPAYVTSAQVDYFRPKRAKVVHPASQPRNRAVPARATPPPTIAELPQDLTPARRRAIVASLKPTDVRELAKPRKEVAHGRRKVRSLQSNVSSSQDVKAGRLKAREPARRGRPCGMFQKKGTFWLEYPDGSTEAVGKDVDVAMRRLVG